MNLSQTQKCLPRELAESQVFLLGRLGYELKRHAIEELEAAGFSFYDYSVLALAAEGACTAQSSMADLLRLDRSQLVGLLDGLEDRGLIERRRDPNDRRRHLISITTTGGTELDAPPRDREADRGRVPGATRRREPRAAVRADREARVLPRRPLCAAE